MMQEHNQDMFTACRKPKHWHPTKSSSAISWHLQFFVDSIDGTAVKPYYQSASTLSHFHIQHGPRLLLIYAYAFPRLSYLHTTVLKLEPHLCVLVLQWNFVTEWILAVNGKHTERAITVCTVHTLLDRTARKKTEKSHTNTVHKLQSHFAGKWICRRVAYQGSASTESVTISLQLNLRSRSTSDRTCRRVFFCGPAIKGKCQNFVRPLAVWHQVLVWGFCSASGAHDVIACLF